MLQFDEEKQNKMLDDLRRKEEDELINILSTVKYKIPFIDLEKIIIDNEALKLIPEDKARELEIASFRVLGKNIDIAVRAPEKDGLKEFLLTLKENHFSFSLYMTTEAGLKKAWERYKELSFAEQTQSGGLSVSSEILTGAKEKIKNIKDVAEIIKETVITNKSHKLSKIFEIILAGAIATDASDIHLEPEEKQVRLRYRLDGVLQNITFLDENTFHLINSRIKILSGLKLTMQKTAQDGRFSIFYNDLEINIRTSTVPGAYGESIVMRLLNPKSIQVKLEDLGMEKKLFEVVNNEINKPNGLILITGPTGSGKTTTLYAFLQKIYSSQIKIITIENPIEYHLEGITQTQIEKDYSFVDGLRAALRQDPDVIMVGEIRDIETAKTAVESALTGHIVFSTLHTNNAAGAIPRLIDLEVSPKIIPSALSLSMAQRLIRKLCIYCKKEKIVTEIEKEEIKKVLQGAINSGKNISDYDIDINAEIKLYEPQSCEKCNFTGFKGRLGIFEAIISDAEMEKIIVQTPSEREIKIVAQKQGILNMQEDGVIKAVKGITSLEEIKSVVDIGEEI